MLQLILKDFSNIISYLIYTKFCHQTYVSEEFFVQLLFTCLHSWLAQSTIVISSVCRRDLSSIQLLFHLFDSVTKAVYFCYFTCLRQWLKHCAIIILPVCSRDLSTSGGIATNQLNIPANPPAVNVRLTLSSFRLKMDDFQMSIKCKLTEYFYFFS